MTSAFFLNFDLFWIGCLTIVLNYIGMRLVLLQIWKGEDGVNLKKTSLIRVKWKKNQGNFREVENTPHPVFCNILSHSYGWFLFRGSDTAQKMKFCIKDFFSKCYQIGSFLRIWSNLLKKTLMENFIFCAVW